MPAMWSFTNPAVAFVSFRADRLQGLQGVLMIRLCSFPLAGSGAEIIFLQAELCMVICSVHQPLTGADFAEPSADMGWQPASAGVIALLPGRYTLNASYGGDGIYAATSVSTPFTVDSLCLLEALRLAV